MFPRLNITLHVDFPGFVDFVAWLRASEQREIDAITADLSALKTRLQAANDKLFNLSKENS